MSIIGCGSRGGGDGLDTPWNFQNIHLGEQHLNIFDIIRGIFVCIFQNFPSLVARLLLYLNRMKVNLCFDVNSKLAVGVFYFSLSQCKIIINYMYGMYEGRLEISHLFTKKQKI